jgi:stage II sporulation protein D
VSFRTPLLAGALAVAAASVGVSPGSATESAAGSSLLRVLLYEGSDPVVVEDASGAPTRLRAAGDGVRAGSEPAQPRWRSRPGPRGALFAGDRYRGVLEVARGDQGLLVINEVPLEEYVAGALGREMFASWQQAALRAQAVAIRSYALHQQRTGGALYHLEADTASQVYGGVAAESPEVWEAVDATRGEVLTFAGEPILAAFHSASGGRTASAAEVWGSPLPYLVSLPVQGEEDSPDTYWRAAVTRTTLARALEALGQPVGPPRAVEVLERTASGRVGAVRFRGPRGDATVAGRTLRAALGESILRSTLFDVRLSPDAVVFVGSGRGHGVGMSQWGARALAESGADYREILRVFYPGTRLERLERSARGPAGAAGGTRGARVPAALAQAPR